MFKLNAERFKYYLLLIRFFNQTGTILLFIPCFLGIIHSNSLNFRNFFLFFVCSFLARSCGCILNDIADKKIDAQTPTTAHRVLSSNKIMQKNALYLLAFIILASLPLLFLFSKHILPPLLISGIFVIIYPYSKRFFPVPQLFLGITYASGFIIASVHGSDAPFYTLSSHTFLIYLALILWVVSYDTIYAKRDFSFDKINKIKASTVFFASLKFPFIKNEMLRINCAIFLIYFVSNFVLFLATHSIFPIIFNFALQIASIFVRPSLGFKLNILCVIPMFFLV